MVCSACWVWASIRDGSGFANVALARYRRVLRCKSRVFFLAKDGGHLALAETLIPCSAF